MNKHKVLRISAGLIGIGMVISMLGFLLAGGNWQAYTPYSNRWYSVVHIN